MTCSLLDMCRSNIPELKHCRHIHLDHSQESMVMCVQVYMCLH